MDLGRFLETAGAMFTGQKQGEMQGQALLQKQQDENYGHQLDAFNLRRQVEGANAEQDRQRREDALRYALPNIRPDQRGAAADHILNQPATPFQGVPVHVPNDRAYAGVGSIFAPSPTPHPLAQAAVAMAAPPSQPAAPAPPDLHQSATLRVLQGMAGLLPGGADVMRALHPQLTPPAAAAGAAAPPTAPPAAPPTVHLFGRSFAANVIDPKAWTRLQGDYGKITKDLEGVTDPTVLRDAHTTLQNWNPNPVTVEDFQGNQRVVEELRSTFGLGGGAGAERFREGQFKTDVAGYTKRGIALQTAPPEVAMGMLPSLLQQEDALIQKQGDRGDVAPTYGLWRDDIEKIDSFTKASQRATAASREAVAAGRTQEAARFTAQAEAARTEALRLSKAMQGRLRGQMKPADETRTEKEVQSIISHWSYTNANNPALTRDLYNKRHIGYLVDGLSDDQMRFGQARAQKDVRSLVEKISSPSFAQVNKATQQVDLKLLFDAQRAAGVKNPTQLSEVTAKLPPGMRERLDLMHRNANRADAEFAYRKQRNQTADLLKTSKQGLLSREDQGNFKKASDMLTKVVTDPFGGTTFAYPKKERDNTLPTLEALGRKGKMDLRYLGLGDYRETSPTQPSPAPSGRKSETGQLTQGLLNRPATLSSRGATPTAASRGSTPQRLPNAARLQFIDVLMGRVDPSTGQPMTRARAEQLASRHR